MLRTHSAAPLVGGEPKAPAWGLGDGDLEGDLGEEQRQGQEEERGRVLPCPLFTPTLALSGPQAG